MIQTGDNYDIKEYFDFDSDFAKLLNNSINEEDEEFHVTVNIFQSNSNNTGDLSSYNEPQNFKKPYIFLPRSNVPIILNQNFLLQKEKKIVYSRVCL